MPRSRAWRAADHHGTECVSAQPDAVHGHGALPADHPSVWRAHRRDNLLALARESDRVVEDDEVANFLWNVPRFPILGLLFLYPDID